MRKLQEYFHQYQPKPLGMKSRFAVFVPLVYLEGELHLLFQVRGKNMRRQPLEICFPGGKMESGETPTQTALREMEEELGISPTKIYGETDFLVLRTGEVIYPVLGQIPHESKIIFNEEEVESVFYVPVAELKKQKEELTLKLEPIPQFSKESLSLKENYEFRSGEETFHVYRVDNKVIWGMTGRITDYVLSFL